VSHRVAMDSADHVATITLDRPEKRNAIDRQMRMELFGAFQSVADDPDIWVAIIRGAGGNFSAGHDLTEPLAGAPTVGDLYTLQHQLEKPLIAALSGACLAQGSGIALSCDIRLADGTAYFAWPQVMRGIGSISGPTMLARALPVNVAMRHLLTGDPIPVAEAASLHLVERVGADETVEQAARELALRIVANAPLAVQAMKRAVLATQGLSSLEAFRIASSILEQVEQTEDAKEGMRAFAEKRPPVWRGR